MAVGPDDFVCRLVRSYLLAKQSVIQSGFEGEIIWQESRRFERVTEPEFLHESTWVILSSGMRERVVRALFPSILAAFCGLRSARSTMRKARGCRNRALSIFNHRGKIDAVLEITEAVACFGFPYIHHRIHEEGVDFLETFSYLGPATSRHLAKNLGLPVAKPDRHLRRIAKVTGFASVGELCALLAHELDEPLGVVDLVLWRYATLDSGYERLFPQRENGDVASCLACNERSV